MPITGVGSWLPTIDEFIAHWTAVNVVIGGTGFQLSGGYKVTDLTADRATVAAAITDVQTKENTRQNAAGDRDVKRAAIRPRILQFGPTVRGQLPGSLYVHSIPRTPLFQASPGVWRDAMDDMANLWATINTNIPAVPGFTPPLKLSGAYLQATFATEATALSTAFTAVSNADIGLRNSREARNIAFAPVYQRMKQYRLAVAAALPPGHPLASSIPALTPPPGATPAPVQLSASWNSGTDMADLVWSTSLDPSLAEYSIRYHPGPRYKAAEEQTVDSVPAGTTAFSTDFGLPAPGSVAWFKVYVVLTTGNEKGSNAVKVVRP